MDRRKFLTNVGLGWLLNNALVTLVKRGYSLSGETPAQAAEATQVIAANSQVLFGITASTASSKDANTSPAVTLISSNLTSGQQLSSSVIPATAVSNSNVVTEVANKALFVDHGERLTGLTALANGTFIISAVVYTPQGNFSQLIFTDNTLLKAQKTLKVSGFKKPNATVESLLATQDNRLLSIVSHNEGKPPFYVTTIDSNTGILNYGADLPDLLSNKRYSNLTQAPNGTIYASAIGPEGYTQLVQLDLTNKATITGKYKIVRLPALVFNEAILPNDLYSLAVSQAGQVYALADPEREGTSSLFTIDVTTGEMTLVRKGLAVKKIAFTPA